jgi:hypothetical protein
MGPDPDGICGIVTVTPRVTKTLIKFLKPQLTPKARTNQVIKV